MQLSRFNNYHEIINIFKMKALEISGKIYLIFIDDCYLEILTNLEFLMSVSGVLF